MALPPLVLLGCFDSEGVSETLDMVFSIARDVEGNIQCCSQICILRLLREVLPLYQGQNEKAGRGNTRGKKMRLVSPFNTEGKR